MAEFVGFSDAVEKLANVQFAESADGSENDEAED